MTKAKRIVRVNRKKRKDQGTTSVERNRKRDIVPNGDVGALMNLRIAAAAAIVAPMMGTIPTVIPVKKTENAATGNDPSGGDEKKVLPVDDTRRNGERNREGDGKKIRKVIANPISKRNDGESERNAAIGRIEIQGAAKNHHRLPEKAIIVEGNQATARRAVECFGGIMKTLRINKQRIRYGNMDQKLANFSICS